ncbi:hypothetical protein D3C73_721820 [compost metagenome]
MNFAFSAPRAGTITAISSFFSATATASITLGSVSIEAHLYHSTAPNNNFTQIPGASVVLGPISTSISIGQIFNGITTGLSAPVTAQARLLMVYFITVSGITVVTTVAGYASGGITIN